MIKLLVLDVDGCMTDGRITYDANGVESKSFNVKDGLAIVSWMKLGGEVAIITGRKSTIVEHRAKELGIKHLYQGVKNKLEVLQTLLTKLEITPQEVAAIGDDLNDYKMLQYVEYSYTPANGSSFIQEIVYGKLQSKGGEGAVREMIEDLFHLNNQVEEFLKIWQ